MRPQQLLWCPAEGKIPQQFLGVSCSTHMTFLCQHGTGVLCTPRAAYPGCLDGCSMPCLAHRPPLKICCTLLLLLSMCMMLKHSRQAMWSCLLPRGIVQMASEIVQTGAGNALAAVATYCSPATKTLCTFMHNYPQCAHLLREFGRAIRYESVTTHNLSVSPSWGICTRQSEFRGCCQIDHVQGRGP